MTKSIVSVKAYAERRGITAPSVRHAIKTGRIAAAVVKEKTSRGGVMLDADIADARWDDGLNMSESNKRLGHVKGKREEVSANAPTDPDDVPNLPSATDSNARKLHWEAKLAKQKYQERAGELVNRVESDRQKFEFSRALRDMILGVPSRIDSELAGESTAIECRKIVRDELLVALNILTVVQGTK